MVSLHRDDYVNVADEVRGREQASFPKAACAIRRIIAI